MTVNAIAPGTVLVPDDYDADKRAFLSGNDATPGALARRRGRVVDAMLYLVERGEFVTGETLVVDGGRLLRR